MTFARTAPSPEQRQADKDARRAALCTPSRALSRGTYAGTTAAAAPKSAPYRDLMLLQMQHGRPCKLLAVADCLLSDGSTTVACHENQGKGMGSKVSDERSAGGCYRCHCWYDQSGAPRAEKRRMFMAAHLRQVLEWRRIAADPAEPERFRNAARRALERLNATPVGEAP